MPFAVEKTRCNMECRMGLKCECQWQSKSFSRILMGSEDTFESWGMHECDFRSDNMYYKQASEHVKAEEDVRKRQSWNLRMEEIHLIFCTRCAICTVVQLRTPRNDKKRDRNSERNDWASKENQLQRKLQTYLRCNVHWTSYKRLC